MPSIQQTYRSHLLRQLSHWQDASQRLGDLSMQASDKAWEELEQYANKAIRKVLNRSKEKLTQNGVRLQQELNHPHPNLDKLEKGILRFKQQYLRTETMFDFYGDAINTRINPKMGSILKACDHMAWQSMYSMLAPLGHETPPVLCYIDKGLGASILKAGLRLWDQQTDNPVAVIKIVRHNLFRSTSLIHEAGHQVAHILDWNEELSQVLKRQIRPVSHELADVWSSWSSEIAADCFAFSHTGYGSVASLHDVVDGSSRQVFRFLPGDPHPISFLRVLLGTSLCDKAFGNGPWNQLAHIWRRKHRIDSTDRSTRTIVNKSIPILGRIAHLCLYHPMETMHGHSLSQRISLKKTDPSNLSRLHRIVVPKNKDREPNKKLGAIELLAHTSWKIATKPENHAQYVNQQQSWMQNFGSTQPAFI